MKKKKQFCVDCGSEMETKPTGFFSENTGKPTFKFVHKENTGCKLSCLLGGRKHAFTLIKSGFFSGMVEYQCNNCGFLCKQEVN